MTIELMHPVFWLLAVGLPVLLALLLTVPRLRPLVRELSPLAALPALALALFAETGTTVSVPLLLETRLGITSTTQVFLIFTTLLWIIAGLYAQSYLAHDVAPNRFFGFYLVTLCGNLGLILARDLVSLCVLQPYGRSVLWPGHPRRNSTGVTGGPSLPDPGADR